MLNSPEGRDLINIFRENPESSIIIIDKAIIYSIKGGGISEAFIVTSRLIIIYEAINNNYPMKFDLPLFLKNYIKIKLLSNL